MSADSGSSKNGMGVEAPTPLNGLISTVMLGHQTSRSLDAKVCEDVRRYQAPGKASV